MLTEAMLAATVAMAPGTPAQAVEQPAEEVQQAAASAAAQTEEAIPEGVLTLADEADNDANLQEAKASPETIGSDAEAVTVAEPATAEESAVAEATESPAENTDLEATEEEAATTLEFSNSSISATGESSGYKISGTSLTITDAGTYLVTGTCDNGSITVKKGVTDVVLVLRDLFLTNTEGTALTCNKDSEVTVQVEGDVILTDAEDPATEETNEDFEGAVIKAKSGSTLTITGTGVLTLDGSECKNGIKGADGATIIFGASLSDKVSIIVNAANNGVACDNAIVVNGGTLEVIAGNDGLKAEVDEEDEASEGSITINGGEIDVQAAGDGMQATGNIVINSGDIYVQADEDGIASETCVIVNGGDIAIKSVRDGIQSDASLVVNGGEITIVTNGGSSTKLADDADSCKGLKAGTILTVNDGVIVIDSADDAVHSNGAMNLLGGTLVLSTGDDGAHADSTLNIGVTNTEGPTITIKKSYEGLEGANINVYSGTIDITASDDGVNAANKDLGSDYSFTLSIYGGTLRVNADGDGLDSNGTIAVYGGNLEIFGAANNGNGAMDIGDRGGSWTQEGGSIIAVGMSGMAVLPTSGTYVSFGSTVMSSGPGNMGGFQMGGMNGFSQGTTSGNVSITAGSTIEIRDNSGNVIYSTTSAKSANSVVFSSDDLVNGQTYTLYVNGSAVTSATATTGNGQTGGMGQQPAQSQQPQQQDWPSQQPQQTQQVQPSQQQPNQTQQPQQPLGQFVQQQPQQFQQQAFGQQPQQQLQQSQQYEQQIIAIQRQIQELLQQLQQLTLAQQMSSQVGLQQPQQLSPNNAMFGNNAARSPQMMHGAHR